MINSKILGSIGENKVVVFLESLQFKILEKNWRSGHKEIDIIALDKDEIVFIEVKTRSSKYIEGRQSVGLKKQKLLIAAANDYILKEDIHFNARFDIAEVIYKNKQFSINLIRGAFEPFNLT
ncbi:MAG: YraN family protein [Bacteroidales bacterium]|nr:YraN family protein [Bacteroidales bacterium]